MKGEASCVKPYKHHIYMQIGFILKFLTDPSPIAFSCLVTESVALLRLALACEDSPNSSKSHTTSHCLTLHFAEPNQLLKFGPNFEDEAFSYAVTVTWIFQN